MKQKIEYTLPEWAFLDTHCHLGNELGERTVILHTRSASVIEIIDRDHDGFNINDEILSVNFKNINHLGETENLSVVLHYCATLDKDKDSGMIKNQILMPCAKWYGDYCDWEDKQILNELLKK